MPLSQWLQPPTNYIGIFLFVNYILVALILTILIITSLVKQYTHPSNPALSTKINQNKKQIWVFSALTLVTFSIMSYNMLNVLITAYQTWNTEHPIQAWGHLSVSKLWRWTKNSSLFLIFVEQLLGNANGKPGPNWFIGQVGLWWTFGCFQYMGREGQKRNIPYHRAYFILAQILPISFVQNLFYLATLLTTRPASEKEKETPATALTQVAEYLVPAVLGVILHASHSMPKADTLITGVLLVRAYLFAGPLFELLCERFTIGRLSSKNTGLLATEAIGVSWILYQFKKSGYSLGDVIASRNANPATTVFADDFVLGVLSAAVWRVFERY